MRLDDVDTSDVDAEDQGDTGGGGGFGFPMGGGGGLPLGGRMGCGSILILLIAVLVFKVDPTAMLGGGGGYTADPTPQAQVASGGAACDRDALTKQSCQVLALGNRTWASLFTDGSYRKPGIRFYTNNGQSACGPAQSGMGPFYCPSDEKIYIDVNFYNELKNKLGADGDFAQDYVIAHELGHHVQKITGAAERTQRRGTNEAQIRLELQADCYAGVWGAKNRERLDPDDPVEGLRAAHQIGDDVLQKSAQGYVSPEKFTHGSAEQRMTWFKRGLESGDPEQCNTGA